MTANMSDMALSTSGQTTILGTVELSDARRQRALREEVMRWRSRSISSQLVYARRLREAGFTEQQAEGQAEALAAAMTDSLATKPDLRELELRMKVRFTRIDARFDRFEQHLDARLADLERRITLRLGGMIVAGMAVMSALVKL
jgi:hypothetical protein